MRLNEELEIMAQHSSGRVDTSGWEIQIPYCTPPNEHGKAKDRLKSPTTASTAESHAPRGSNGGSHGILQVG